MRILLLNQFFWPNAATGQLLGDLADHLSAAGQDVTVICGSSDYSTHEGGIEPRAQVIRLRNSQFSRRLRGRVCSYFSFLGRALWTALRVPRPLVVVTMTTPPLLSLVGMAVQTLRGSKHVIWEMDIYPDAAVDLGVLKPGSIAATLFRHLADLPRRRADRIIVLGECMRERLIAHGIPREKIFIADNWSDHLVDRPDEPMKPGKLSVLYSGNLGMPHDVETIASAAAGSAPEDFEFIFAGGGSRHEWLQEFCATHAVASVRFAPYCSRRELGDRLASAHIGLVTQRAACLGSLVPSKTYGVLAAGRPILFVGPKNATPALIIARHDCGWQVDCGDVEGLTTLLAHLNENRHLVRQAGRNAYKVFVSQYERCVGVTRVAAILGIEAPAEKPMISFAAHR